MASPRVPREFTKAASPPDRSPTRFEPSARPQISTRPPKPAGVYRTAQLTPQQPHDRHGGQWVERSQEQRTPRTWSGDEDSLAATAACVSQLLSWSQPDEEDMPLEPQFTCRRKPSSRYLQSRSSGEIQGPIVARSQPDGSPPLRVGARVPFMSKHLEDPAAPAAAIPRPLRSSTVSNQAEDSSAAGSGRSNVIAFYPRPATQARQPSCRDVSPPKPTLTPPPSGHASNSGPGSRCASRPTLSPPQHPLSGPGHGAGGPYPASMSLDDGGGGITLPSSAAACPPARASAPSSGSTPPEWRESAGGVVSAVVGGLVVSAVAGSVFATADAPAATPPVTVSVASALTALDAAEREELLYLRRRVGELEATMEAARTLLGDAFLAPALAAAPPPPSGHGPSRRATADELETLPCEPAAADAAATRGAQASA